MRATSLSDSLTVDPAAAWDFSLPSSADPQSAAINASHATATTAPTQALYLVEPGDTTAISANDIHQGQLGDCFLLSSIGEIAIHAPSAIAGMIHSTGASTETVTLYAAASGWLGVGTTSYKPLTESVTNVFPSDSVNNGATQDVVGGVKEIWPQVLEKAYAQANGGYGGIAYGGSPIYAMEQLTGHAATYQSASSLSAAALLKDVSANDLIVMDTASSSSLPFNLVGNHAYMFEGVQTVGGVASVKLGNPWGYDQPSLIPIAQLSKGIVEVDIGHA